MLTDVGIVDIFFAMKSAYVRRGMCVRAHYHAAVSAVAAVFEVLVVVENKCNVEGKCSLDVLAVGV